MLDSINKVANMTALASASIGDGGEGRPVKRSEDIKLPLRKEVAAEVDAANDALYYAGKKSVASGGSIADGVSARFKIGKDNYYAEIAPFAKRKSILSIVKYDKNNNPQSVSKVDVVLKHSGNFRILSERAKQDDRDGTIRFRVDELIENLRKREPSSR
jgi:hypothetical protein